MKKVLLAIGALFLAVLPLSAQQFLGGTIGMYNISGFAYGNSGGGPALQVGAGGGTSGSYSITLNYGQTTAWPSGIKFTPFTGNGSVYPAIAIGSGATYEVVTPSAVSCSTPAAYQTCQITATFSYSHGPGDVVRAADGGLQEAILWAGTQGIGIGPIQAVFSIPSSLVTTMYTTPVVIMPAPGGGQFYSAFKASATGEQAGTAYTGGGAITLEYGTGGTNSLSSTFAATVLTNTSFYTAMLNGAAVSSGASTGVVNQPLELTNATAVFATGTTPLKLIVETYVDHN